jgi:hypothetical protein
VGGASPVLRPSFARPSPVPDGVVHGGGPRRAHTAGALSEQLRVCRAGSLRPPGAGGRAPLARALVASNTDTEAAHRLHDARSRAFFDSHFKSPEVAALYLECAGGSRANEGIALAGRLPFGGSDRLC